MSQTTIAGTQVGIELSEAPEGGWLAVGHILEGGFPSGGPISASGSTREEAESRCRKKLARLIHVRTCCAE